MRWKLKSVVQNAAASLPSSVSYASYYWMQRHFGALRRIDPLQTMSRGITMWRKILENGHDPTGKSFMEIGTGRMPLVPLALWLMGAGPIVTFDLHPYLRWELVQESLRYLFVNPTKMHSAFGSLVVASRLDDLSALDANPSSRLRDLLALCGIRYVAPGDAADTELAEGIIDFHVSNNVLEHVPPAAIQKILHEGSRVVKKEGLFIHLIDYSDHFSHSDKRISSINFLQFSDARWARYAGNRYMYMNRLRHDDFLALLESSGHEIVAAEPSTDQRAHDILRNGLLRLDERFASKSHESLSIVDSWIVSRAAGNNRGNG